MEALYQQHKSESHVLKMRVQDLEASFADADKDQEVSSLTVNATSSPSCWVSTRLLVG